MTYIHISQGITKNSIKRNVKIKRKNDIYTIWKNSYVDL